MQNQTHEIKSFQMGVMVTQPGLDSKVLISGGAKAATYLKKALLEKGYLEGNENVIYSSLNADGLTYWSTPDINVVGDKVNVLILNNANNHSLYVFYLNLIDEFQDKIREMKYKNVKREAFDIQIVMNTFGEFVNKVSGKVYNPYLGEIILY